MGILAQNLLQKGQPQPTLNLENGAVYLFGLAFIQGMRKLVELERGRSEFFRTQLAQALRNEETKGQKIDDKIKDAS